MTERRPSRAPAVRKPRWIRPLRSGAPIFVALTLLFAAGAARLAYIEQAHGDDLRLKAERQHTATWPIPALRGEILDARGRVLSGTTRRPSVFVDPSMVEDPRFAAYSVAPVLQLPPAPLEQLIRQRQDRGFAWVKRGLSSEQVEAFSAVRRVRRLSAFGIQDELQRVYPFGHLAAQVLGFIGEERQGLAGIEQSFNDVLRGSDGRRVSTVDVRRRRLRSDPQDYVPPRDGASVVLTIDAYVQQRTESHLRQAVEKFKARWGTAIVMDPLSGEVLAMATVPDYDPAEPVPADTPAGQQEAALERIRNRAISDAYEPGSVFKPFIVSPSIEEGLARLDELLAIRGPTRQFGSRTIHDTHAYGTLTLHEVISKSSNIGAGLIGARCGNARLNEYVRRFGFGDPTGIALPGEHPGLVQDFSRWTSYSAQSIPIGQELGVTPIQVATAFCAFANDGILMRPRIVRGVLGADGSVIADCSRPVAVRRVLDAQAAREFRLGALVEAVLPGGTGRQAALSDYRVFGKTGTAQIAEPGRRGYIPGAYMGSFVGGAPADRPRAVVLVSICRPASGQYYGGTVAAPAAGAILADTLAYMRVPSEVMEPSTTSANSGRRTR